MEGNSSSQPNPMTEQQKKEDIFFDDVRNFLSAVDDAYVKYSFEIDRPEIEESQIKLRYHPLTPNGSINSDVDGWLQIYLRALGYKGGENLVEKDLLDTSYTNGIHYRHVTVNNTGKRLNSVQLQLSVANKKKLQLKTRNDALQSTKTDLENVLAGETAAKSELETLLHQKERQNEELKSLNTENSKRIAEIQGKVDDVLRSLQENLQRKCPDNLQRIRTIK